MVDRRSYLKATGVASLSVGSVVGLATLFSRNDDATDDSNEDTTVDAEGTPVEEFENDQLSEIAIDFDQLDEPREIYRVWTCDTTRAELTTDRAHTGDQALEITVDEGESCGTNAHYWFPYRGYGQPTEMYQSCQIRLSENWTMEEGDQCKIFRIGLNTEAGPCGTGVDCMPSGDDGWSASLIVKNRGESSNDSYRLATYNYHMDQLSHNEDLDNDGEISPGEWFEVESYLRMNTVDNGTANADGVLRIWLDGDLIFERDGRRWTSIEAQAIEYGGPFVNYGGRETAPERMAVTYDDHRFVYNTDSDQTGEMMIEISGFEDLNEYALQLEGGSVRPGENADTHDHEFQDRVIQDDETWYIHGYVSEAGIDDYHAEESNITGIEVLEGEPEIRVNDFTIDPDEYDDVDTIPENDDNGSIDRFGIE